MRSQWPGKKKRNGGLTLQFRTTLLSETGKSYLSTTQPTLLAKLHCVTQDTALINLQLALLSTGCE